MCRSNRLNLNEPHLRIEGGLRNSGCIFGTGIQQRWKYPKGISQLWNLFLTPGYVKVKNIVTWRDLDQNINLFYWAWDWNPSKFRIIMMNCRNYFLKVFHRFWNICRQSSWIFPRIDHIDNGFRNSSVSLSTFIEIQHLQSSGSHSVSPPLS